MLTRVALGAISLGWLTNALSAQSTPSFLNDVEPILTRLGCNQGACHGKQAGQNGFRLSLRGFAPEWDHGWITREFHGRRVNIAVPEASLLLRKPAGQAQHEGGKLLEPGGMAYQVLRDWIRVGAPGPRKQDPVIRRLDVQPASAALKPGQTKQLKVTAAYTDGQTKDVTWLTRFDSNDANVATISPDGLVQVIREGETAIRASFQGHVAIALVTAPHDIPVKPELFATRNNFIDEHVFKKLCELRIEPSELCDDNTFIRRVFLDAMGTLPTPDEVRAFVADSAADKRVRLVGRVLERPEFVDFWAMQLGDLLMNRKESDHDVRGVKGVRTFHEWIRRQVAINRPWDELARDLLTVSGDTHENPEIGYFIVNVGEQREAHKSTVVANAAQTFLGVRIGCAQCHNHPLEKYTQDDYYHFAGYFSRIRLERKDPKTGPTSLVVSHHDKNQNKSPVGVQQPRTGQFLAPQTLDRVAMKIEPGDDPRRALAEWLTSPSNKHFAGAMVNRIWAHFFNVGLVEPVDDLRDSNPPTNPALSDALVKEFIARKYDRKHMMRLILNSRAYQLSATTKPGNEKDQRFYSHYYVRRLPSEVLLDAVTAVTGTPERFEGYPLGIRAIQVPDPAVKPLFLQAISRPERITACACERSSDVTLPHLLHLSGQNTLSKVTASEGRVARELRTKKGDAEVIDEFFLLSVGRLPKADEREHIDAHLRKLSPQRRAEAFHDLVWALLNTKEFVFNH